jgi:hypothetical protein
LQVTAPCHILQSNKDLAVPVVVSGYLQSKLGGPTVVEVMQTEGHLPQLSSPEQVTGVLIRHIVGENWAQNVDYFRATSIDDLRISHCSTPKQLKASARIEFRMSIIFMPFNQLFAN